MAKHQTRRSISLSADVYARLRIAAEVQGVSMASLVTAMLEPELDRFEREHGRFGIRPGDLVRYHPVIGEEHDGEIYVVSHEPWYAESGTPVVSLREKSGFVAVAAVSKIPEEEI